MIQNYPELEDNYWFDKLWSKVNHPICNTWNTNFELGTSDLKLIDQAAKILDVDYDLDVLYQRVFPISNLHTFVTFNLKKSYSSKKANRQQAMFKNVNNSRAIDNKVASIELMFFMFLRLLQ